MKKSQVLHALSRHIGERHGVCGSVIVAEITGDWHKNAVAERQLRELIKELRLEGEHICGLPSTGYYMAETPEELERTCEFLYSRSESTWAQIAAMKRISVPDLRGQLHLPT
ncbi:hypothetical protein [Sulfuriflexus mobilis]|uniref:hypothetical protein n=1 Tax=Sulfuriflexus mobilis TaxID=1811807 RepID=UPI000F84E2C1|nr:hypothetical protein [Sulfuriflexus mobilis]